MKHPRFSALYAKSKSRVFVAIARLLVVASLVPLVATLIAAEPLAKGIQDNSFFIEEAYNQEPGVVQHILNVPINFINGSREITPSFTQEWPVFSQTHQFSYTIPHAFTEDDNGHGRYAAQLSPAGVDRRRTHSSFCATFLSGPSDWRSRQGTAASAAWVTRPICLSARS